MGYFPGHDTQNTQESTFDRRQTSSSMWNHRTSHRRHEKTAYHAYVAELADSSMQGNINKLQLLQLTAGACLESTI